MRRIINAVLWMSAAVVFAAGCQGKPAAVVNGEMVTEKMVSQALKEKLADHRMQGVNVDTTALRKAVLDEIVAERLLLQGAGQAGISTNEGEVASEYDKFRADMGGEGFEQYLKDRGFSQSDFRKILRERMTIQKFYENLVPLGSVREDDIKEFYRTSPQPFLRPEMILVRFIQAGTEPQARDILFKIQKAGSFDKVAEDVKADKMAIVSDYALMPADNFGPQLAAQLKGLNAGSYGGPFKGAESFYVFNIKERQPQRPETYSEAREKIAGILLERMRQSTTAHWIAQRKASGKVVVN